MNHDQSHTPEPHAPEPVVASCKPRRGLGELLRSVAGTAAGWRPNRRGSFLVLVVGTLALLAVMALIYSSIGTHDKQMVSAGAKRDRMDDVPQQVANYITALISEDTLSTYYESKLQVPDNYAVPLLRKTADYPSTSWEASSAANPPAGTIPFNPTGSVSGFMTAPDLTLVAASAMPKSWAPSSPWLSSPEATFLNFAGALPTDANRPYLDNHDIAHISNIAPDGLFVNLANLRNNFNAPQGTSFGQMSSGLSLFDANGNVTQQPDYGMPFRTGYIPAKFDSRQQWMFRPARPRAGVTPNNFGYEPNQYASPDGSGMWSGRWQELKDSRFLTDILHTDGKFRYFVSTRIIDASGLVNVNTAADLHAAPTAYAPAGSSTSDIDLARVLSMYDTYAMNGDGLLTSPLRRGYDGIFQPSATNVPSFYGGTATPGTGLPTNTQSGYDQIRAELEGRYSYTALRLALGGGTIPPAFFRGVGGGGNLSLTLDFPGQYNVLPRSWDTASGTPSAPYLGFADPYLRTEFSINRGLSFGDTVISAVPAGTTATFRGGFGINDLAELITWRSANDPTFTSPLEMAIDGRDDFNMATYPDSTRFGPLRSNRGLDVEHDQRYTFPAGTVNTTVGGAYDRTMLHFASDIRQRLTTISGERDFRQVPPVANTTVTPAVVGGVSPDQLLSSELRIDPRPTLSAIKGLEAALAANPNNAVLQRQKAQAINTIFSGYADALLPTSGVGKPWNGDPKRATEFYGMKGPELAIHAAAHATLNMIDMYDVGGVPTVQTLLLSRTASAFVNNHNVIEYPSWVRTSANFKSNGLELPDWRLGDLAGGDAVQAPAVNMYGIEAQPFLTQVATFTVYADATNSPGIGGDDDGGTPNNEITINPDTSFTNADLMYRVVAFQLTNPFGVDVKLGTLPDQYGYYDVTDASYPAPDREANFYYIKFGDKTFKLARLSEAVYTIPQAVPPPVPHPPEITDAAYGSVGDVYSQIPGHTAPDMMIHLDNITIPAGKTVVCYALSDIPRRILKDRLGHLTSNPAADPAAGYFNAPNNPATGLARREQRDELKLAIEHQLGRGDPDIAGVYWIPEVNVDPGAPQEGQVVLPDNTNLFPATPVTEVTLWRAMRYGNEAQNTQPMTVPPTYWDGSPSAPNPNPTAPPHNDFTNDQLVDRVHLPGGKDIEAKLAAHGAPLRVAGTVVGTTILANDPRLLYMITTHASVRRKADPNPPLGAIPGYCLEAKFDNAWNFFENDGLGSLNIGDFTTAGANFKGGGTTVAQWLTRMRTTPISGDFAFIKPPNALTTPAIGPTNPNGDPAGPFAYNTLYPQININDAEFQVDVPVPPAIAAGTKASTLRAADMLLPLGIGPEEMPFDKANQPVVDMDLRWTTLSEALALAMGYQTNPPPTPATTPDTTYPYYVTPGNTAANKMPLDRGNLRLDDSAPFYDANGNGVFDNGDQRLGLELPLALNVLDIFTAYPVDNRSAATFSVLGQTLTTPSHGKININTMSTPTSRSALSMLSPPPQAYDISANPASPDPWWWWAQDATGVRAPLNGAFAYDPANPTLPWAADIAASVISWRDKIAVPLRPISQFVSAAVPINEANFTDLNGVTPDQPEALLSGRGQTSQVASPPAAAGVALSGIHERPGFGSIAELAIVRTRLDPATDPSSPAWPINMDWLGNDNLPVPLPVGAPTNPAPLPGNSGVIGLDSVLYTDPAGGGGKIPDRLKNEYKEQLELLNSVIGNVSTRSDYFIVWFQIQGYQKSDVDNLGDNDPMIPSINRRFVMVVDRSKVTKRGDKADVLLFKEVPVDTH